MFGDLKDRVSLDPACQGVEVVITTANSVLRGGDDTPQTVDLLGNRNLIDAAKAAGVKQFIFISVAGADPNSPAPFVAAKGQTEVTLRASGMPYTILAPAAFMEIWIGVYIGAPILQGQPVTIVGEGRRRHSFIAAGDVAAFTLAAIENPTRSIKRSRWAGRSPARSGTQWRLTSACSAVPLWFTVYILVSRCRASRRRPGGWQPASTCSTRSLRWPKRRAHSACAAHCAGGIRAPFSRGRSVI